jgi:predicted RNase H-like nuclease (RuvC/YqgF family)
MKRNSLGCVAALLIGLPAALSAQDTPAAVAERQETEERFKTLTTRLENLEETIQAYRTSLDKLTKELGHLRDDLDRVQNNNSSAGMKESLRLLEEAIKEVDRKRIADNEKVLATLDKLAKNFSEKVASSPPSKPLSSSNASKPDLSKPGPGSEKGYEYVIKEGDTLSGVVSRLHAQGFKVSQKQVADANPGINWSRLRIGQKIFIPAPVP